MKTNIHFFNHIPAQFFLAWEMFQTKAVEKIKTQKLRSLTFSENRVVYEIIWKNIVQPEKLQM
jgi:hypothetical protein